MTSTHETPMSLFSHNKCRKITIKHWELDLFLFHILLIWGEGAYAPNAPPPPTGLVQMYHGLSVCLSVSLSVSLSVCLCWTRLWDPQRWPNRLRYLWGMDLGGPKQPCSSWGVWILQGNWADISRFNVNSEVLKISGASQSYSIGGSSNTSVCCQYCGNLLWIV